MPNYEGDVPATRGKDLLNDGDRMGGSRTFDRTWFCRSCGQRVTQRFFPRGWYSIERHTGNPEPPVRLGAYCTVDCMSAMMTRLAGIERSVTDWDSSEYRQRRT